jgi:TolB-like protein
MRALLTPSATRFLFILLLAFAVVASAAAQQRPAAAQKKVAIAVLDFDTRGGITKDEAASLSDIFQSRLVKMGEFIVVDRNRIKSILVEQGFQQSEACSQVECVVDVGRILKVQKMFAGTIGKVGKIFNINIMLIDVTTAQIASTESRQYDGALEDLATDLIPDIADAMAKEMTGKDIRVASTTSGGGIKWYWYVGGAVVAGGVAAVLLGKSSETSKPPTTTILPVGPAYPN